MSAGTMGNMTPTKKPDAEKRNAEQEAALTFVRMAKEKGLDLTGPDGLLNDLTDTWRVVPGDRLVTFKPDALPESWRISSVRPSAADLCLVVNDPMTGEPFEPDLMAILSDGCFDFDMSRETPEWQGFWKSEHGMVAYRDASGFVRRWTLGHGLGTEVVSPAKHGLWFDVPDVSLAKLIGQGCQVG